MKYNDEGSIKLRKLLNTVNKPKPVTYLISLPAHVPIDNDTKDDPHVIYMKEWVYEQLTTEAGFDLTKPITIEHIHLMIHDMVNAILCKPNTTKDGGFNTCYIVANSDWLQLTDGLVETDFYVTVADATYEYFLANTPLNPQVVVDRNEFTNTLMETKAEMEKFLGNSKYGREVELTGMDTFSILDVKELSPIYVSPNTGIVDVFDR